MAPGDMHAADSHSPVRLRPGTIAATTTVLAMTGLLSLPSGCESTSKGPPANGNVLLQDENNYHSTSSLSIPTVETAPSTDLDICWTNVVSDLQCHGLAPQVDLDNLAVLRFLHLSQDQVETKLTSGELIMSQVDGYLEHHLDHSATCAKLSQLSFFGTPINVQQEFVESPDQLYMLVVTEGTNPGVGARTMAFLKPTASSINTRVDVAPGCGLLEFSADLASATPVRVPTARPWVIDWRNVTRNGQGNGIVFESIDGVLLGFYEGKTVADLQAHIFDIELLATSLWELPLTGGRTADLSKAVERGTGAAFPGFARATAGVWMLALRCSTCQNPAPVVLTVLEPGA